MAEGADLVLAAGGDGTINEVVEGMVNSTVPLGILPAGTANVLAAELGIGLDMMAAAERVPACIPQRISVGRLFHTNGGLQSRYFLLMAGVGFDAQIVYNISASLKTKLGKGAYWIGGLSQLGRKLEEFQVEVEDRVVTCSFALISKVRNYGGNFQIARNTSLLDDHFEVVLFEGRNSVRYLKYLAGIAARRVSGMAGVSVVRSQKVLLSASPETRVYIQVDGEYAGRLPAKVEIVSDALTLLVPPDYRSELNFTRPG